MSSLEEHITDIAGVRVVCSFQDDIYKLAEILAKQDDITVLEVKDYIQNPKPNGYQSIHTVVYGEGHKVVEVQIRTEKMHQQYLYLMKILHHR